MVKKIKFKARTEERVCRWCNDLAQCLEIDIEDTEGDFFRLPVCKKCILTSPEYSIYEKCFIDPKEYEEERNQWIE